MAATEKQLYNGGASSVLYTDRRDFYVDPQVTKELWTDVAPFTTMVSNREMRQVPDPIFKMFEHRNPWVGQQFRNAGETVALDPQSALPQGLGGYGPVGPIGTMFDQIDPSGQYTGRRLGRRLDARTTADELNILAPTIRKWAEQAKRDDLMRSLAAEGVKTNIGTNAALTQMAAEAGARQATTAANQLGSAITGQYTY